MAEVSNTNNSNNVSAGKGVKGGYIFSAPVGTTLPDKVIKNKSELTRPSSASASSPRTATSSPSPRTPTTRST